MNTIDTLKQKMEQKMEQRLEQKMEQKVQRLREILASRAPLIVAYSGGVDSAYLAWTAHQVLGG